MFHTKEFLLVPEAHHSFNHGRTSWDLNKLSNSSYDLLGRWLTFPEPRGFVGDAEASASQSGPCGKSGNYTVTEIFNNEYVSPRPTQTQRHVLFSSLPLYNLHHVLNNFALHPPCATRTRTLQLYAHHTNDSICRDLVIENTIGGGHGNGPCRIAIAATDNSSSAFNANVLSVRTY